MKKLRITTNGQQFRVERLIWSFLFLSRWLPVDETGNTTDGAWKPFSSYDDVERFKNELTKQERKNHIHPWRKIHITRYALDLDGL